MITACYRWFGAIILLALAPARAEMGESMIHGMVMAEALEYGFNNGTNPIAWEVMAWVGGDEDRIQLMTEGELATDDIAVEGKAQLLYSRLITAYWELQFGLRGDLMAAHEDTAARALLAIGLDGLAPYWIELTPAVYVSHQGDVSAHLTAMHDLYITQDVIAQSSAEVNFAVQAVPDMGIGRGLNDLGLGLRLRYELVREAAPYLGVTWRRRFGDTADRAAQHDEPVSDLRALAGLRFWY